MIALHARLSRLNFDYRSPAKRDAADQATPAKTHSESDLRVLNLRMERLETVFSWLEREGANGMSRALRDSYNVPEEDEERVFTAIYGWARDSRFNEEARTKLFKILIKNCGWDRHEEIEASLCGFLLEATTPRARRGLVPLVGKIDSDLAMSVLVDATLFARDEKHQRDAMMALRGHAHRPQVVALMKRLSLGGRSKLVRLVATTILERWGMSDV